MDGYVYDNGNLVSMDAAMGGVTSTPFNWGGVLDGIGVALNAYGQYEAIKAKAAAAGMANQAAAYQIAAKQPGALAWTDAAVSPAKPAGSGLSQGAILALVGLGAVVLVMALKG